MTPADRQLAVSKAIHSASRTIIVSGMRGLGRKSLLARAAAAADNEDLEGSEIAAILRRRLGDLGQLHPSFDESDDYATTPRTREPGSTQTKGLPAGDAKHRFHFFAITVPKTVQRFALA